MRLPASYPDRLRTLHALWDSRRGGRAMPALGAFGIDELKPWLSETHLVAVHPDGLRFAVFASGPASRYGREMTGRYVSDLEPETLATETERSYRAAAESRAPAFCAGSTRPFRGKARTWSRLILPLSDDGLTVDHLLVAIRDDGAEAGANSIAAQELMAAQWALAAVFGRRPNRSLASPGA